MKGNTSRIRLKDELETQQNIVDPKQEKKEYDREYCRKICIHTKEIMEDIINTLLYIINLNIKDLPVDIQVEIKLMCSRKDIRQEDLAQTLNNRIKHYCVNKNNI